MSLADRLVLLNWKEAVGLTLTLNESVGGSAQGDFPAHKSASSG